MASDLAEFDKDSLEQFANNLCQPGGRVADPNPNTAPGAMIPTLAFTFGVKSQKQLLAATNLVKYYVATSWDLTARNLQQDTVMKNFEIQWKALRAKKEEDTPKVSKISKAPPCHQVDRSFPGLPSQSGWCADHSPVLCYQGRC